MSNGSDAGSRKFVVMRFKRIKTWGHVYHVRRHNTREMECRHLEEGAPPPRLIAGSADVAGNILKVLDRYQVKPKTGQVLALEFVISASREVFEGLDKAEYDRKLWQFIVCAAFAFGERFKISGQTVSMALHEDERTPHLHVVVVPLVHEPDNRRTDKRPVYRLSAKRIIGGRGDMAREQTRFASHFERLGLERGKHRSGARHVSNREHEARLETARQGALAEQSQLQIERERVSATEDRLRTERDALAADKKRIAQERLAIATERVRLKEEGERLEGERAATALQKTEAEELKRRAIRRTEVLRDLLEAGERLRDYVLALPAHRKMPQLEKAHEMSVQLEEASRVAAEDDAWLTTALAHRVGKLQFTSR